MERKRKERDFFFRKSREEKNDLMSEKVTLCGTLYMVGLLVGSYLGGPPADALGRKPTLFGFILLGGIGNFVGGLVSNFNLYAFFRLLAGISEQGMTQVSFTLAVEMVDAKYQGSAQRSWRTCKKYEYLFYHSSLVNIGSTYDIFQE